MHKWLRAADPPISSRAENAENVLLLHDEVLLAVELDLVARILAEEDPVAFLHREGEVFAVVVDLAGPDGDHLPRLRLLLGAIGDDETSVLLVLLLEALDENAVMKRTQQRLHCLSHGAGASLFQRCQRRWLVERLSVPLK